MIKAIMMIGLVLLSVGGNAQKSTRKAIFLILDGIPADVIEKVPHPNLEKIAKIGGYSRATVGGIKGGYNQSPTISAVGYNHVLTGTWTNKHNVWGNAIKQPNYHYPTVFRFFKDAYPQKKIAVYSTWADNRTKLVGDRLRETGNLTVDLHVDSLEYDTLDFPHDDRDDYIKNIDDSITNAAVASLKKDAPDLSWVYLQHTDDMGHQYGDSPVFYQAVHDADQRVGKIWDAIEERKRKYGEDWLIIVTTDHGRDSVMGKNHGGQSQRERTSWIFTNASMLNPEFNEQSLSLVDILPTICKFLKVSIPKPNTFELDGEPFIGRLSFNHLSLEKQQSIYRLKWNPLQHKGALKMYMTNTNDFKMGKFDDYQLIGTVPVKKGYYELPTQFIKNNTEIFKFVVVGLDNTSNVWLKNN